MFFECVLCQELGSGRTVGESARQTEARVFALIELVVRWSNGGSTGVVLSLQVIAAGRGCRGRAGGREGARRAWSAGATRGLAAGAM